MNQRFDLTTRQFTEIFASWVVMKNATEELDLVGKKPENFYECEEIQTISNGFAMKVNPMGSLTTDTTRRDSRSANC